MFDNGNNRASAYEDVAHNLDNVSRAVEYQLYGVAFGSREGT